MTGIFTWSSHLSFGTSRPWHKTQGALGRTIVPMLAVVLYAFFGAILFYFIDTTGPSSTAANVAPSSNRTSVFNCFLSYSNNSFLMAQAFKESRQVVRNASKSDQPVLWEITRQLAGNVTNVCPPERLENKFMTIMESLFYCWTVYTTIGYGVLAPATWGGKLFTIIYAVFGIPIMAYALLICGDQLFHLLWIIYLIFQRKILKKKKKIVKRLHPADFPFWFAFIGFIIWWLLSALWFALIEQWNYLDSFYMVFCSLTKIGLGDISSTHPLSQITAMFLILYGMILISMAFSLAIIKRNHLSDQINSEILKGARSDLNPEGMFNHEDQNGHVANGVIAGDLPTSDLEKQPVQPERATVENNLGLAMREVERLYLVDAGAISKLVNGSQRKWLGQQLMRVARMRHVHVQTHIAEPCERSAQTVDARQWNVQTQTEIKKSKEQKVVVRRPVERSYTADLRFFPKRDMPFSLDFT